VSPQISTTTAAPELAALYAGLSGPLRQIVRLDVTAPEVVIEDACQFAWGKLVRRGDHVQRDAALAWLVTTAVREACRLLRRAQREVSLDELLETESEPPSAESPLEPHGLAEARERLATIKRMPPRQQRMVWLQAIGLDYEEMAAYEGCTRRTVERQLMRAKRTLRCAATQ